jgi:Arc/MetJ-type ribon-helix-helix transcriptional regulator
MRKTTVYLPEAVKASLERMAASTGRSEADLIREAISSLAGMDEPPRPRFPLFESGDPIASRVDELLAEGFGLD